MLSVFYSTANLTDSSVSTPKEVLLVRDALQRTSVKTAVGYMLRYDVFMASFDTA